MPNPHQNDNNNLDATLLYQQHRRRLEGITTSKILLDLMLEIQRHRAASLASLGGEIFFENRLWSIQKAITQQLAALDLQPHELLTKQEQNQLYGEWVTVRSQWQKDTMMQNFLLHNHLIDIILKLNISVCERAGHSQLDDEHQALSDYCMRHLPLLIESAAQARGLATHSAAQNINSAPIMARIRYLITDIKQLDARAQSAIVGSSTESYRIIQQSRVNNKNQLYIDLFLKRLKEHFTETDKPGLLSDEIYSTGSHFIMATYDVLLRAYKLMSKSIDTEMKAWIYRSSYHS